MNKNLFTLLFALLIVCLIAQDPVTQYTKQGDVTLDPNILNLGYSPDQKTLVELITNAEGQFIVYQGIRGNIKQTVPIVDGTLTISPSTFAFSQDNSLLVVGSKQGSVYGFAIQNGVLQTPYSYKYNIQDIGDEYQVNSISISPKNQIAIGARNKLVILSLPTDGSNLFVLVKEALEITDISAVRWKNADETSVLFGCTGVTGLFAIYDIGAGTTTTINTDSTSGIGVFKDGRVLQGKVVSDIQIWNWDQTNQQYQTLGNIANTVYATQIILDSANLYFGAEIKTATRVLAWKIDALTERNLQNSQLPTLPTLLLNQTGTNLALSGNGNQILIVTDATNVVARYNLCNDGAYYNEDKCIACEAGCKNCFDATTCLTCPQYFYITDTNTCASCDGVTAGCLDCLDSTTCTLCNPAKNRNQIVVDGVCKCNDLSYQNGDQCTLCNDSLDFCQSCSDAKHCTACYPDGNINPTPQNDHCDCLDTWYLEDKVCKPCNIITGCVNCNNANTCTLCDDANSFEPDGKGGCQCKQRKWYNQETLACELCNTKVPGCLQCEKNGVCTACKEVNRVPNPENTDCVCRSHTFEDPTNVCQVCDPYEQCLQCKEANNCTICDTTQNRVLQPVNGVCQCKQGYIESTKTHLCFACTVSGCLQCGEDQVCSKCFTSKHFQQNPIDGECVCQSNYHPVSDKSECLTCKALTGCINCDNLNECKQCNDGENFELNQDTKKCQCKASFYEESKKCNVCSEKFSYCQNCNKDKCQSCKQGFTFNDQDKCSCPSDRDFDETAGTCEEKAGLSALAIIAIVVGVLALAGAAVAIIKCFKKRQSPLEDGEYEALEGKDK